MPVSNRTLWIAVALVFAINASALAQGKSADAQGTSNKKSEKVLILSATLDRANETLTLRGSGFGSQTPSVFFENFPLSVLSATDAEVVTYLPSSVPDGTYLFTVVREHATNADDRGAFSAAILKPKEITGPQGEKGDTGDVGPAGPQGEVGPQGSAGVAGPKGDTGATGPAGPAGATGAIGPQGPAGPQGDTGATGAMGPQGPAGATGPAGPQGERGLQGEVGPSGPAGATGATGATGLEGPAGPQGVAGPRGDAGLQGPAGPQGPMGLTGPQGPAGVIGLEVVRTLAPVSPAGVNTGGRVTGIAVCSAGKRVISGGFDANYTQTQASSGLVASASFPLSDNSWQVTMRNPGGFAVTGVTVSVYAVCVSQ